MKYAKLVELLDEQFKRLTGVHKETFEVMVELVNEAEKNKKQKGGPQRLCIEDQVLLTLSYLREYRTQEHIAFDYNISQQTAGKIIKKVENILIASEKFALDELKNEEVIIVEAMECPIERPQKNKKNIIQARKKDTLKKQK